MLKAETEITLLTSTVDKINEEIDKLYHRRSQLLVQLNNLTSTTRHLPPEILTEIFRLSSCTPNLRESRQLYYVDIKKLLKIGSICTQWRRVAWNASQLWTTSLLTPPLRNTALMPVWLTSLVLENCQGSAASVRLDLTFELSLEQIEVLFKPDNLVRIGSIRLHLYDEVEMWNCVAGYFRTSEDSLQTLRELWIIPDSSLPVDMISGLALQPLGSTNPIEYVRRERDCVPWEVPMFQLTILRLYDIPVDQCLYLLLQGQCLIEFHCVDPKESSGIYNPPVLESTKHIHSIKQLRWHVPYGEWNLYLFSFIRFPCLERLFWGNITSFTPPRNPPPEDILRSSFFPSLNNTLVALDLESEVPSHAYFSSLLTNDTTFAALRQLYIVTLTSHAFVTWMELLTFHDVASGDQNTLLPGLKVLYLEVRNLDISEPRAFRALVQFLASRRRNRGGNDLGNRAGSSGEDGCEELERLCVDTYLAPIWLEEQQLEVLEGFVAGGLVVEIKEIHWELRSHTRTIL